MLINEDFFDNNELSIDAPENIDVEVEVDKDDYQFQIQCMGIKKSINYDLDFFEKCIDSFRMIEHSKINMSYDGVIDFYFNHTMKCPEDVIKFVKILWVATGREMNTENASCAKLIPKDSETLIINLGGCGNVLIDPITAYGKYNDDDEYENYDVFLYLTRRLFGNKFDKYDVHAALGFPQDKQNCITNTYIVMLDSNGITAESLFYHSNEKYIWTSFNRLEEFIANKEISSKYFLSLVESKQTSINTYVTEYPIDTTLKNALAKVKYGRKIQPGYVFVDFWSSRIILDKKNENKFYVFPLRQKITEDEIITYFVKVEFKSPIMRSNIDVTSLLASIKIYTKDNDN